MQPTTSMPTLQRLPELLAARGVKRAKHYLDIRAGLWTRPVAIGRASAWPAHETAALNSAYISGASHQEIKALVSQLHAARKAEFAAIGSHYLNQALSAQAAA